MTKENLLKFFLLIFIGLFLTAGGYELGRRGYAVQFERRPVKIVLSHGQPPSQELDFSLFWQVYDLLQEKFLGADLNAQKLLYSAAQGLYRGADDPYTVFLPPKENKEVTASLNGQYEGIGASLEIKNGRLIVLAPLDDSPAQLAGLKPLDWIVKIEDQSTEGLSVAEAVDKIRGPAGSKVRLSLSHFKAPVGAASPSAETSYEPAVELSVVRAAIKVESLKLEDKGDGIFYLRLSRFGDTTAAEWDRAISKIRDQGSPPPRPGPAPAGKIKAVILDLRSNPGGYFQAAIHVASEFLEAGVVSYQEFAHNLRQEYKVDHLGSLTKTPAVVLLDKGSASAAEIVAGALRDRRGFKIVGEKSFGKGSVQDAQTFPDGSGVHVTIARWLTPKGHNIQGNGLEPDFKVEISETDINNGKDPQLDKALEVARNF